MARDFGGATGDYGIITSLQVTALPISVAFWANVDSVADYGSFAQFGLSVSADTYHRVLHENAAPFRVYAQSGNATSGFAVSTTSQATGSWCHVAAVFASDTSRSIYLNGGGKATNTTSVLGFTPTRMTFMEYRNFSTLYPLNGKIQEIGIWNVALTDAEVYALSRAISPLSVRPDALGEYWPMLGRTSPEQNMVGGSAMTLNGTANQFAHNRMIRTRPRLVYVAPAAAGGGARRLVGSGFSLAGNGGGLAA